MLRDVIFHIYEKSRSRLINLLNDLYESDIESENEKAKESLEEIKNICPLIDSFSKLMDAYTALQEATPIYEELIRQHELSDNLEDHKYSKWFF